MQFDEIQAIFFQECEEGLASAETGLMAFQRDAHDDETINTIFRAVHSIKGGAGAFGFNALQAFTHQFETVLDLARCGELAISPELIALLLRAFDTLSDHVAAIRGEAPAPDDRDMLVQLETAATQKDAVPATVSAMPAEEPTPEAPAETGLDFSFDDLMATLGEAEAAVIDAPPAPEGWSLEIRPGKGALANGGEPTLLLRELVRLGGTAISTDTSAIPLLDIFDPGESYLGWTFNLPMHVNEAEVREIFEFVLDSCDLMVSRPDPDFEEGEEALVMPQQVPEPSAQQTPATQPALPEVCDTAPRPTASATSGPVPDEIAAAPVTPPAPPAPMPAVAPTPATAPAAHAIGSGSQTIRVDLEKLDRLVNLVGELVITQAMLVQKLGQNGMAGITELTDLDHLTRELQDSAMSIRAQPIKSVFSRVPRIVRELEAQTGKQVQLEIEGEMTELDKTVVERIGEPLTHLIRNAVDHGLESPEDRVAAGKPAQGTLRLAAEHRSGRILISVADDGNGIDRQRVRKKAIDRGLIAADAVLTDEEIDNLIFAPGFSTADNVSNISGRGVGMDVVRRNVEALGGRISIHSRPGKGSVFTLALPLTLAILDGMIVTVGCETFVIPLAHIVESLRPQAEEIKSMGNGRLMLDARGTFLSIEPVARQLGVEDAETDPTKAVLIVVDTESAGRSVLMVDAIVDQRQVVIKSLEANYRPVADLSGATILGDGRVALILDVESLTTPRHDRKLAA